VLILGVALAAAAVPVGSTPATDDPPYEKAGTTEKKQEDRRRNK